MEEKELQLSDEALSGIALLLSSLPEATSVAIEGIDSEPRIVVVTTAGEKLVAPIAAEDLESAIAALAPIEAEAADGQ